MPRTRHTTPMWKRIKRGLRIILLFCFLAPVCIIISLNWINPPTTSFMLQHAVRAVFSAEAAFPEYQWRHWREISDEMKLAVIAAEDQKFPVHHGIDFSELGRVIRSGDGRKRGASTITQQAAKNLFLWPGRSYIRKGLEAGLSLLMELFLDKRRILEIYLNIAQTGTSLFGVSAASQHYFRKPPLELNRYESARIAAILPNPKKYSVSNPSAYIVQRQKWILKQMKQLGTADTLGKFN